MYPAVVFHINRTTTHRLELGYDVSADTLSAQIRVDESHTSTLIANLVVDFETDGTDGNVLLTLTNEASVDITNSKGFMDVLRMSGGEPLSVFAEPLPVIFRGSVTT